VAPAQEGCGAMLGLPGSWRAEGFLHFKHRILGSERLFSHNLGGKFRSKARGATQLKFTSILSVWGDIYEFLHLWLLNLQNNAMKDKCVARDWCVVQQDADPRCSRRQGLSFSARKTGLCCGIFPSNLALNYFLLHISV
jgi:hypothetical protein